MNIEQYQKLYKLFSDKDWHSKKDYNDTVFSNFCTLLNNLTDKQQNLIIELIERYDWLSFTEYNAILIKLFNSIPKTEIDVAKKIYLFPVVRISDEDKTKSGHGILFLFRGIRPFLEKFSEVEFIEVEKYNFFDEKFTLNDGEFVYLLDDFLGSGSTLEATILELEKRKISKNQIRVLCIASHIQAVEYMEKLDIIYYTELVTKKGISEFYTDENLKTEKIEIMNQIEKLLPTKKFNFGFGKSEALITLYRTPNNTFPIFWLDHSKDEKIYKAPFPRF